MQKGNTFVRNPGLPKQACTAPNNLNEIKVLKAKMQAILSEGVCSEIVQKCIQNIRSELLSLGVPEEEIKKIEQS